MADFEAQVEAIILKTEKRMRAVVQIATEKTIVKANTPTAKGGRMRVETGFLRASGRISFTGMPSGPSRNPDTTKTVQYSFDGQAVTAGLAGFDLGATIYFGWAANYARVREVYDGFLETALMDWQGTVDSAVRIVKARIR